MTQPDDLNLGPQAIHTFSHDTVRHLLIAHDGDLEAARAGVDHAIRMRVPWTRNTRQGIEVFSALAEEDQQQAFRLLAAQPCRCQLEKLESIAKTTLLGLHVLARATILERLNDLQPAGRELDHGLKGVWLAGGPGTDQPLAADHIRAEVGRRIAVQLLKQERVRLPGAGLRLLREQTGMSQSRAAQQFGVLVEQVEQAERGGEATHQYENALKIRATTELDVFITTGLQAFLAKPDWPVTTAPIIVQVPGAVSA